MNQAILNMDPLHQQIEDLTLIKWDKKLPVRKFEKVENLSSSKEKKIKLDMGKNDY